MKRHIKKWMLATAAMVVCCTSLCVQSINGGAEIQAAEANENLMEKAFYDVDGREGIHLSDAQQILKFALGIEPCEVEYKLSDAQMCLKLALGIVELEGEGGGQQVGQAEMVKKVIELVNVHRQEAGLVPFTTNDIMKKMADVRAQELVQKFDHVRPDGRSCFSIFDDYQVEWYGVAENIAWGQTTAEDVVEDWMNSEGHRKNIMNGSLTKIGVGIYEKDGEIYWVQLFMN